jgi:hypothetical protein
MLDKMINETELIKLLGLPGGVRGKRELDYLRIEKGFPISGLVRLGVSILKRT